MLARCLRREITNTLSNSQLWKMAEQGRIDKLSVFENQDANQIIWTGNSFAGLNNKDTGIMSLNDKWHLIIA